jgi:hypothetical protein
VEWPSAEVEGGAVRGGAPRADARREYEEAGDEPASILEPPSRI